MLHNLFHRNPVSSSKEARLLLYIIIDKQHLCPAFSFSTALSCISPSDDALITFSLNFCQHSTFCLLDRHIKRGITLPGEVK